MRRGPPAGDRRLGKVCHPVGERPSVFRPDGEAVVRARLRKPGLSSPRRRRVRPLQLEVYRALEGHAAWFKPVLVDDCRNDDLTAAARGARDRPGVDRCADRSRKLISEGRSRTPKRQATRP